MHFFVSFFNLNYLLWMWWWYGCNCIKFIMVKKCVWSFQKVKGMIANYIY